MQSVPAAFSSQPFGQTHTEFRQTESLAAHCWSSTQAPPKDTPPGTYWSISKYAKHWRTCAFNKPIDYYLSPINVCNCRRTCQTARAIKTGCSFSWAFACRRSWWCIAFCSIKFSTIISFTACCIDSTGVPNVWRTCVWKRVKEDGVFHPLKFLHDIVQIWGYVWHLHHELGESKCTLNTWRRRVDVDQTRRAYTLSSKADREWYRALLALLTWARATKRIFNCDRKEENVCVKQKGIGAAQFSCMRDLFLLAETEEENGVHFWKNISTASRVSLTHAVRI